MPKQREAALAEGIAKNYGGLRCKECSIALRDAFQGQGIDVRLIQLRARNVGKRAWIVMKDLSFKLPFPWEPGYPISENGMHYGVLVHGVVYDNIFRSGIALHDWPLQFECVSSQFEILYPDA